MSRTHRLRALQALQRRLEWLEQKIEAHKSEGKQFGYFSEEAFATDYAIRMINRSGGIQHPPNEDAVAAVVAEMTAEQHVPEYKPAVVNRHVSSQPSRGWSMSPRLVKKESE